MFKNFLGQEFIKIPEGRVTLKSKKIDPCYIDNMETYIEVPLNDFFIQRKTVTVAQYSAFLTDTMNNKDYLIEIWDRGKWIKGAYFYEINNKPNFPVVGVSYIDSLRFISWLNQMDNSVTYDLPSEAQFEYAAKAKCNCNFDNCFNTDIISKIHFREKGNFNQMNLKSAPNTKNSFNIYHTNGVVWQWCKDWYKPYDSELKSIDFYNCNLSKQTEWRGEKFFRPGKVIRGGSFSYEKNYSSCTNRHFSFISDRNNNLGFRLVATKY